MKKATKKIVNDQDQVKNQLARALADYDNLRKRVDKERNDLWEAMLARFVLKFLPVYDMLQNAQKHTNDSGVGLTLEEFKKILKEEGIEEIKLAQGDDFSEESCEAVDTDTTMEKNKKGKISAVLADGFKLIDGKVLRPAKVRVYN